MSLKVKLMDDLKLAMKDKNVIRKNTIQMVRAAILQVEKDNKIELDDVAVTEVIAKELKKRNDVLPDYEKSGRDDLVANIKKEIETLLEYLPKQLSHDELKLIVKATIDEIGASSMKDIGKIMGAVLPKVKGVADGKLVNEIAKELLS